MLKYFVRFQRWGRAVGQQLNDELSVSSWSGRHQLIRRWQYTSRHHSLITSVQHHRRTFILQINKNHYCEWLRILIEWILELKLCVSTALLSCYNARYNWSINGHISHDMLFWLQYNTIQYQLQSSKVERTNQKRWMARLVFRWHLNEPAD